MELLISELEKFVKCNDKKNDPINVFIAVFIATGILVSYLPQVSLIKNICIFFFIRNLFNGKNIFFKIFQ
jgi:hypothetical protein